MTMPSSNGSSKTVESPLNKDSIDDDEESFTADLDLDESVDFVGKEEEKNQTKDLLKRLSKDSRRVMVWRVLVTLAILGTAAAVTGVTFKSLKREEDYNFETAFSQFALTVGDAATEARRDLIKAYKQFADTIAASAESAGATWPLYTMPLFEKYASNFLSQARTELISLRNVIRPNEVEEWNNYTAEVLPGLLEEAHMLKFGNLNRLNPDPSKYTNYIYKATKEGPVPDLWREFYVPTVTSSPPARDYGTFQWNIGSHPNYQAIVEAAYRLGNETLVTKVGSYTKAASTFLVPEEHALMHDPLPEGETEHPHSMFFHPIRASIHDPNSTIVAILSGAAAWDQSMRGLLPMGVNGILAIIYNNCNQSFTYEINGPVASYLGKDKPHSEKYEHLMIDVDLAFHSHPAVPTTPGHCQYGMRVFPTQEFEDEYHTNTPRNQAIIVAATFVLIAATFLMYDIMVANRNQKLILDAARSNAMVSQLFPAGMANKMIHRSNKQQTEQAQDIWKNSGPDGTGNSHNLQSTSKVLADLYLEASVSFADITGFTAWSSVRSPDQVFELLETVYRHFDDIAKRRGIFKVETVGDCYVAASGLPVPRSDHALIMARFAREIVGRMNVLAKKLEESLGPDTGDLSLRVGIHSGPVTAGVLRGERARFQLFGDTVNTASRLETNGQAGRILVSKEFADLLQNAGKSAWVEERKDKITARGKGAMATYWLVGGNSGERRSMASQTSNCNKERLLLSCGSRKERLVDWCCQQLEYILRQIVARRRVSRRVLKSKKPAPKHFGTVFFDEVAEIIVLPEYDAKAEAKQGDRATIVLDSRVLEELHTFVSCIASKYNENYFHNFEHASHVLMSVSKLMARIVAPKHDDTKGEGTLHDYTFGITSDPLTQFACAFSALIHDVDHDGVSNAQLVKEDVPIARQYYGKSVAEQNSLALSWDLLMEQRFDKLRATICATDAELVRFRGLVVNSVMATDIVDKELKELRNGRWAKAFREQDGLQESANDSVNRKATIVIEHLIQASDVSHMMQHWHVYRKWNTLFFQECYQAYLDGRADKDPSETWYKGEIGFYDFYIIPLAKKLKECGVFGVSSGEYISYAQNNRDEWVERGEEAVAEMIQLVKDQQPQKKHPKSVLEQKVEKKIEIRKYLGDVNRQG